MKTAAFLLCLIIVAACEDTGSPLPPCTATVVLDDGPINLPVGDSVRVIARVSPLGPCGNNSKRVEWSAQVPIVQLRSVNDTTIQITATLAGSTFLRARSVFDLSGQDSVRVITQ